MTLLNSVAETLTHRPDRWESNDRPRSSVLTLLLSGLCIGLVTVLLLFFHEGISVGFSNHVGIVPVVRRILDPNYLPNDFGIAVRLYHHRIFALIMAAGSAIVGEDQAFIALSIAGKVLLSSALFYLCRVLGLSLSGFLAVGFCVATSVLGVGKGLEINNFVGIPEVMPPIFAHSLILLSIAMLLQKRLRLTALLAGLVFLVHVQIGVLFVCLLLPFYGFNLKSIETRPAVRVDIREIFIWLGLFLVPASPALGHFVQMMQSGLNRSLFSLSYINFRHPHHFQLESTKATLGVIAHLLLLALTYLWLHRSQHRERHAIRILMMFGLLLAGFSGLHYVDYYGIQNGTILKLQWIRLSPLITVMSPIALITALNVWAMRSPTSSEPSKLTVRRVGLVNGCIILIALTWSLAHPPVFKGEYEFGVRKYADQSSAWVNVCRWINDNGPSGTVYLTPPGEEGFTYLSNRSTVVEFKINPDGGYYLPEWFDRLKDMAGGTLPNKRGFQNGYAIDDAFATLTETQLKTLGTKYNAKVAVVRRSSAVTFPTLYQNDRFRVVKIS